MAAAADATGEPEPIENDGDEGAIVVIYDIGPYIDIFINKINRFKITRNQKDFRMMMRNITTAFNEEKTVVEAIDKLDRLFWGNMARFVSKRYLARTAAYDMDRADILTLTDLPVGIALEFNFWINRLCTNKKVRDFLDEHYKV